MERQRSFAARPSAMYTSIDRGSRVFWRHQLAFADDSIVEKVSVRRRVRSLLLSGVHGMILAAIEVFLSLVWVALYIAETYYSKAPTWMTGLNWFFVGIFSILWMVHFAASANRLHFVVSWFAIIDYVTIIPLFFSPLGATTFIRVVSILRIFRILRILLLAPNERIRKLLQISCILLCFLFISSSMVLIAEPETFTDFFTSFYFVVVAIFTVGFGDITPSTMFGQAIVILVIVIGVVLLPLQAFLLSRIFSQKEDSVNGTYSPGHESKHILLFANNFSPARLTEMITEFTVKYRFQRHIDLHLVIMQSTMPGHELRELADPPTDGPAYIHVLYGSPLHFDDLQRVSAKTAECAVTMFDNDHDTCLVHMALKSYNRSLAIFALLQRPEKSLLFRAVSPFKENHGEVIPTVVSRHEICGALLARCIPTRGFATLICNLVRTRMLSLSAYEDEHEEYKRGAAYEIYFGVLPSSVCGSSFLDICMTIYIQHSALLIGLMTDGKHPLINPGSSYVIKGGELAIFLAPDPTVTQLIKDMQNLPLLVQPPQTRRAKKKAAAAAAKKKKEKEAKEAKEAKEREKEEKEAKKKSEKKAAAAASGVRPVLGSDSSTSGEVEMHTIENASRITGAAMTDNGDGGDGEMHTSPARRRAPSPEAREEGNRQVSRRRQRHEDQEHQDGDGDGDEEEEVSSRRRSKSKSPKTVRKQNEPSSSNYSPAVSSPSSSSKRIREPEIIPRTQLSWNFESDRNKLIRYHEVAKRVDLLSKHYRVLDSPRTFRSAILQRAPESGHIIFTGWALDWVYYVAPLRNRSVSKCQPIIIVTTKPLTQKQWSSIAHFPEVYMMPGASLLKRRDIERLHVLSATHILITYGGAERAAGATGNASFSAFSTTAAASNLGASTATGAPAADTAGYEDLHDEDEETNSSFGGNYSGSEATPPSIRDALLIYSWLSRVCPTTRLIMDIRDEQDLRFLHKAERAHDAHIQLEIRSGVACATAATVERLLAQTVYNPLVLDVVLQLIFGTRLASLPDNPESRSKRSSSKSNKRKGGKDASNMDEKGSDNEYDDDDSGEDSDSDDELEEDLKPIIRLEQIPSSLKGASYRELFEDLVYERDAIPLGLYRSLPRLQKLRKQQYVYTCPPMDTSLQPGDRVYVLFPSVPKA